MTPLRMQLLTNLVARLASNAGWNAQLRGKDSSADAAVRAVVAYDGEDKTIETTLQYHATLQCVVFIIVREDDVDPVLDDGNIYRYLDRMIAVAEKTIHVPDSWGLDVPGYDDVHINGHDVGVPSDSTELTARLSLTFRYRCAFNDPDLVVPA